MLEKFGNLGKSSNMMHIWPWISQKGDLLSLLKSSLAQALTEPTPKAQKRRPSKLKFPKKMPEMAKKCPKNMSYMLFSVVYGVKKKNKSMKTPNFVFLGLNES